MAERQALISFDELLQVEITCECGTGIVISTIAQAPNLKQLCPGCGRSIYSAAQAVLAFKELYAKAKGFIDAPAQDNSVAASTARSIRFRIKDAEIK